MKSRAMTNQLNLLQLKKRTNYIVKNGYALIFVLIANLSELSYFIKKPWLEVDGYVYKLGEILYYNINQLGYLSLLPSLILYKKSKNIESKGLYLGLIVWNCFEMLQEINLLFKLDIKELLKNDMLSVTILQIIFINFTILLTYYGYKKWRT